MLQDFASTLLHSVHKKWSFSLRISSVNVTKSAISWKFLFQSHLLRKSLMEKFLPSDWVKMFKQRFVLFRVFLSLVVLETSKLFSNVNQINDFYIKYTKLRVHLEYSVWLNNNLCVQNCFRQFMCYNPANFTCSKSTIKTLERGTKYIKD